MARIVTPALGQILRRQFRLDWQSAHGGLGRVGTRPDPRYLGPAPARDPAYIENAWRRSTRAQSWPGRERSGNLAAHSVDEDGMTRLSDTW